MSISDGFVRPLSVERWKDTFYEGSVGWKDCLFPARVGISALIYLMQKLFPLCTLTWHLNIYVSHQRKNINRKNESTKGHNINIQMISISNCISENLTIRLYQLLTKTTYKFNHKILLIIFPVENGNSEE